MVSSESQRQPARLEQRVSTDYFVVAVERFVDLSGARVRIRANQILSVAQCTAEQRAYRRRFYQALDREEEEDDE
jgi:hypothetical protein